MIRYNEGNKAYQLFDPVMKKCYIHRDVIFNEKKPRCEIIEFIDNKTIK